LILSNPSISVNQWIGFLGERVIHNVGPHPEAMDANRGNFFIGFLISGMPGQYARQGY